MDALKSAKYTGHRGTKQNDRVAHAAVANARGQCRARAKSVVGRGRSKKTSTLRGGNERSV